jgi:hypothetical protein
MVMDARHVEAWQSLRDGIDCWIGSRCSQLLREFHADLPVADGPVQGA